MINQKPPLIIAYRRVTLINNNLINVGKEIEAELIKIRNSVNAPIGDCTIKPIVDEPYITGRKLKELASSNPDEPIIIEGEYTFVYIRDHAFYNREYHDQEVSLHSNRCFVDGNKIHFYLCQTIKATKKERFDDRYNKIIRINNIRQIDLSDATINTRLPWCKFCIKKFINNGGLWNENNPINRAKIAEYGDMKKIFNCVKLYHKNKDDLSAIQLIQDFYYATKEKR